MMEFGNPKVVVAADDRLWNTMLNGVMLLWFVLTAMALGFVVIDIRAAPISPVMKLGFVLLTAYTGPIGAFLYVLGCREPLPGLHERYIAVRWRQVLGSAMHSPAPEAICWPADQPASRPVAQTSSLN